MLASFFRCIMANLNATEERREHILFSDCIYPSVTAVMVRDENVTGNVEGERVEVIRGER